MEVGSGEREKEVPLQHSECQGDLRLVSSSRVSQFSNAGPGSLSSRVIFTIIILSEVETFLSQIVFVCSCVCLYRHIHSGISRYCCLVNFWDLFRI